VEKVVDDGEGAEIGGAGVVYAVVAEHSFEYTVAQIAVKAQRRSI